MVQTQHTNAFETTLRLDFGPTALTAEVQSTDGSPASPCYLVIEPTNADRREYVLFDGTFTSTQFVTSTVNNRYLMPGSAATSGITHPAGSIVRFAPVAQHFTDHHSDAAPHLATSAATGNRLMLRDAAGRSKVAAPAVDDDAANKGYVDSADFARVETGSYTGDGANPRTITTAFTPSVVYIVNESGAVTTWFAWLSPITTVGTRGVALRTANMPDTDLEVQAQTEGTPTTNGFVVRSQANVSGDTYRYVAFG